MIHYAVTVDGKVIGSRSSASHAVQIYTHALIVLERAPEVDGVVSYHGSPALAETARRSWSKGQFPGARLEVVPVAVTARRAKVGDVIVAQGVL